MPKYNPVPSLRTTTPKRDTSNTTPQSASCAICSKPAKFYIGSVMMCVKCYKEHQADITGQGRLCEACDQPFNTDSKTRKLCDKCLKSRPYNNKCARESA